MKNLAGYLYIIFLSLWFGGMSIFTFIVTPVIFRSYPRDTAGEIVGRLFPSYFLFAAIVSIVALILLFLSSTDRSTLAHKISLVLVSIAVIKSLYVNISLYPAIKKVKQEVTSFESTTADNPARQRFGRLHAQSAIINLFMIADGLALIVLHTWVKKQG